MRTLLAAFFVISDCTAILAGQTKQPLQPKEYGNWETIANGPTSVGLSPDGKWLAYQINRSNRNNELRLKAVSGNASSEKSILFGADAAFSADSRWVAYSIGVSEAQQNKLQKDKKPVHRKIGVMDLSNGEQTVLENVEAFAFSPSGAYLAMRRYAPERMEKKEVTDATADPELPAGATLIVRGLGNAGKDTSFGNVSEFLWQNVPDTGRYLAFVVSSEDKTGNGVQLYDPATGTLRVLDSSSAVYSGLAWRKKSDDLAVLRADADEKREGSNYSAIAWRGLGDSGEAKKIYEPAKDSQFPKDMRVVAFRKPTWADDGGTVFLGYAKWKLKPPAKKKTEAAEEAEDPPAVDIWHWRDTDVMSKQKTGAKANLQRNMVAAWNIDGGNFVMLGKSLEEQVTPLRNQKLAMVADWSGYAMNRSIGRPAADLYLADTKTGQRTRIKQGLAEDRNVHASPGGRYLIYLQDDQYWTVNVATRAIANITKSVPTSFINRESDVTVKQKPPFGIAGWTKDDGAVVLYDEFDLWQISPDGSHAMRLTDGAKSAVRHRYVNLNPEDEAIDLSQPVYLSLFGVWTKQSGYATLQVDAEGHAKEEHLLLQDKSIDRLAKAKKADAFAYVSQSFAASPNVYVGSKNLANPIQATDTNSNQTHYAWGHEQLVEYKNKAGARLQGALYYPAGYEAGRKYPMVVYMYEKLSDGLHRYVAPSERDYYNAGAITSHGYFLLEPDISFVPREPGVSVADCVGAAVKEVIRLGMVDPKKIGIVGHSWGGFDSAYLATHTNLFAAAVAGAPITDLVSNYGNHHWSSGIAETDHIETGQQRMEVPIYEDLQAYIRNSAIFNVQNMTTPLLIEVGDADGTVFYHQGVELYNIARRAKKNVVLLVYGGEDHGLRKKADQMDYQSRILTWFGHYLKGEPAPAWVSDGMSYQQQQEELKSVKN